MFWQGPVSWAGAPTFSRWTVQTERLGDQGSRALMLVNWIVPVTAGLAAAGVGWALGASLDPSATGGHARFH